jgi:hypothetical protein
MRFITYLDRVEHVGWDEGEAQGVVAMIVEGSHEQHAR